MASVAPYDTLENVVNTARVRLNDAIQQLAGDVLTDTAVFTLTFINAAWRRLQQLLSNYGVSILNREFRWFSVPAATQSDFGTQVWFDWDGYFDGTNILPAPVLPTDMIFPLDLWERVHGSNSIYTPIDQIFNGLPTVAQGVLNRLWEWRENKVYMPGSTGLTDIRMRYAGFLADFLDSATLTFDLQQVPIVNVLSPFAWFLCAEVAKSRGDLDAGSFDTSAQTETRFIFDRDAQRGKSIYKRSEYGKMVDFDTPLQGPAGPRGLPGAKG